MTVALPETVSCIAHVNRGSPSGMRGKSTTSPRTLAMVWDADICIRRNPSPPPTQMFTFSHPWSSQTLRRASVNLECFPITRPSSPSPSAFAGRAR